MDQVISMSIGMFVITFLMGYLPSKINTSKNVMDMISLYGAGLLVGAALIVIVPEGIEVLYDSKSKSQDKSENDTIKEQEQEENDTSKYIGASLMFGFLVMLIIDKGFITLQKHQAQQASNQCEKNFRNIEYKTLTQNAENELQLYAFSFQYNMLISMNSKQEHDDEDQKHPLLESQDIEENDLKSIGKQNTKQKKDKQLVTDDNKRHESALITTIGLVVHSIADGLAMGSSIFLSEQRGKADGLGLLIFLAIILHKIPASIGFGTFLYHQGLRGWGVAKHVLAFTLSCPIFAIASFLTLYEKHTKSSPENLMFWVGIILLISAGSFIYVATIHILPEVLNDSHSHGETQLKEQTKGTERKLFELLFMILGLISPFLLIFVKEE